MTNAIIPYTPRRNQIYAWDALQLAQHMPSESVNCIVTSPPYYGLRDYGVDGQIGLEDTPERYVDSLVRLFREIRRALRSDGCLWLNLGDSYSGSGKGWGGGSISERYGTHNHINNRRGKYVPAGLKEKDLIGIPFMVAFALRADGWYLRSDIIWSKKNPMPESVTDRPTKAHEYIFLMSKSPRYYYDADAIREPHAESTLPRYGRGVSENNKYANGAPGSTAHTMSQPRENIRKMTGTGYGGDGNGLQGHSGYFRPDGSVMFNPLGRNKRTVWEVTTKPFHAAHFATFPEDLIEPMILAGCPKGGLVYDPFMGAGTTALVAQRLGRDYLGSELNPEYVELARARVDGRLEQYLAMKAGKPYMEGLFTA